MFDYRITYEKRNKLSSLGRALERTTRALSILPNIEGNAHLIKVYEDELDATIAELKEALK